MKEYICDKCGKDCKQKSDYLKHINKKYPCVSMEELKKTGTINEDVQLNRLEQLFNKMRDILRDNENIVGKDALDIISDFLLLRLLKPLLKKDPERPNAPYIDMLEMDYNTDDDAKKYKEYIYWDKLVEKANSIATNNDKDLLDYIIRNAIFKGVLRIHPTTSEIFREKAFVIKKTATIISLIKEINKFDKNGDFDNIDVDVKGKAYELTIQKEASTNKDFGQFFTPRWIVKYMVEQLDAKVNEDGSYDKIMDPACGTAGFLTEYYKYIRKKADKQDVLVDSNVQNYVYGYEIVSKTRELALINLLLNSGMYNHNVKQEDFLEKSVDYIKKPFKGHILTNPPFSTDKDYEKLCTSDEYKKVFPIKTKSGTFLFLQACMNVMEDGFKCCLISPNGKEIFGKNKEFVEIRKNLMEICNLYKIAYLPTQSFKPYTGVETLVLFFEKGKKTEEIEFCEVERNKDDSYDEIMLKCVKIDEIIKKNYSWNFKDYEIKISNNQIINRKYESLDKLCEFNKNIIKHDTSVAKNTGKCEFITGGEFTNLFVNKYDNNIPSIIINRTNGKGKCNIFYRESFSCANQTIVFYNKKKLTTKYIYYYLKLNIDILQTGFIGMNHKNISLEYVKNIRIPLPSRSLQQKIVEELDAIYNTIDGLKQVADNMKLVKKTKFENLMKNKKTLEYTINDLCKINYGKRIVKDRCESGNIPVYGGGGITFYTDEYNRDGKTLVISRFGISENCVRIISGKFYLNDNGFSLESVNNNNLDQIFLNHYCININEIIYKCARGQCQLGLDMDKFRNLKIKLPSIEDQKMIIKEMEQLDSLDSLVNKQIQDLEIQAKETLERHLNSTKNLKTRIMDTDDNYRKVIKKVKNIVIEDDNEFIIFKKEKHNLTE